MLCSVRTVWCCGPFVGVGNALSSLNEHAKSFVYVDKLVCLNCSGLNEFVSLEISQRQFVVVGALRWLPIFRIFNESWALSGRV